MISNIKDLPDIPVFICKKPVMEFLVYKCNLAILSYADSSYYFAETQRLKECIKNIPLLVKFAERFTK